MPVPAYINTEFEDARAWAIQELSAIPNPEKASIDCACGHHSLTVAQLIREVESYTSIGVEHVQLAMKLRKTLADIDAKKKDQRRFILRAFGTILGVVGLAALLVAFMIFAASEYVHWPS